MNKLLYFELKLPNKFLVFYGIFFTEETYKSLGFFFFKNLNYIFYLDYTVDAVHKTYRHKNRSFLRFKMI